MTACPADQELDRLLADELSADEEAALETHVAACVACKARLDRLTAGPLVGVAQPVGSPPGHEVAPQSAGVLGRVAVLPAGQVRLLEQEHALRRGNGTGCPTPPRSAHAGILASTAGLRFTVLCPHAEGGLGRVRLARDGQLRRTVALKEIRPERADDPQVRQRFLNEAEITGQLEHPGVVPIYALEYDEAGRPVYAMRFIQGRTLSDAIELHHRQPTLLGLRELLQRFVSVCQTVAFAHSRGVIHRDLKPENVMLGDYGETLVVDWGLAKRLGAGDDSFAVAPTVPPAVGAEIPTRSLAGTALTPTDGADEPGRLTVAGQVMGTPAYMAPEQARGEALSPAADVYALGAVLFTLLTGRVPYQGTTALEILRKVAAGEPPDVAGGSRALNAVYFKAMARDPRSRYATAAELARDVVRWLADEPVSACREPWPARAGRWARRHRTLVTSLGVATALLVGTGVGVTWWQSRLTQERGFEQARQAEEQQAEKTRNSEQVESLLDRCEAAIAADDAGGARLAIGDAEKRAEKPGADYLKERLARCRAAADLLTELDWIDESRWATKDGKQQGNAQAVRRWPDVFARVGVVLGRTPPAEAAAAVNGSLARERLLAALDLWFLGAASQDRAALAGLLAATDGDTYRDAVRTAVQRGDRVALIALAAREEALNQPARFATALGSIAEVPSGRKLAILGRAAQVRPRAFSVLMTAGRLHRAGDASTAADRLSWYRAGVSVRPGSSGAWYSLGMALQDKGDVDGAVAAYRAALATDPKLVFAHINLGLALRAKGDVGGAVAEYRVALSLDPDSTLARNNLGLALLAKGDVDAAISEFRAAIATDPGFLNAHNNLGLALQDKGDLDEAVAEFRAAMAIDPRQLPPHTNLAEALKRKGDLKGAVVAYQEATRLFPNEPGYKQRLAEVERWQALMPRLDDVAAGKAEPASAAEAVEYSTLCRQPFLKQYAASARLFAKACAADQKYANDPTTSRRHDAARCAALAGCGGGTDAPSAPSARAGLRGQALVWLETNRKLLARRLASSIPGDRKTASDHLSAYLTEKDLAGVRPGAARDGWASSEVSAWDAYWSEVRALLARANEAPGPAPSGK